MRIRKRSVPLHISSLSPIPLSDHHQHHHLVLSRPVQHLSLPSPDLPDPDLRTSKNTLNLKGDDNKTNIVIRDRNIFGEQSLAGSPPLLSSPSSSSREVSGRWREDDGAVPLKKRRTLTEKSKANEKCVQGENDKELQDKNVTEAKKSKRGDVIMEGSRCSRVNGRGWRCCQQTLVGYSLCEHHLGKGRLRSRAMASLPRHAKKKGKELAVSYGSEEEEEKKKRKKIGMVKARSISSLLALANTAIEVAESNK